MAETQINLREIQIIGKATHERIVHPAQCAPLRRHSIRLAGLSRARGEFVFTRLRPDMLQILVSLSGEGRAWLEKMLARPGAQACSLPRAKALSGLAFLTVRQLGPEFSRPLHEESLALWRELGDPRQTGYMHVLRVLGTELYYFDDMPRGRALVKESLALAQASGDKIEIAWSLFNLGMLTHDDGQPEAARALLTESLTLHRQAQLPAGVAYLLNVLSWQAQQQADWDTFRPLMEECLQLFRALGDKGGLADALSNAGAAEAMQGHIDRAALYYAESLELAREIKATYRMADALYALAWVQHLTGHPDRARQLFLQHLRLERDQGRPASLVHSLVGFSAVAAAAGQAARAVQLLSAAEAQRAALKMAWGLLLQAELARLHAALWGQLPDPAFAEAWAAGETLPLAAALAYALQADV